MDQTTKQSLEFNSTTFTNERRAPEGFLPIATEIRRDIVRMLVRAGSGHSGGPLGSADIFAVMYFGGYMRYQPQDMAWEGRDRFVLSAGHMAPVMYAALANAGCYPKEEQATLRKYNTRLQGHPGRDMHLPGVETSSGSLGQGLSIAVGLALGARLQNQSHKIYACISDGECGEGCARNWY
jgi:transketolase